MYDHCCSGKILGSGKFPKTAWRALHSRQAAHMCVCNSGFLKEPPGGETLYRQATQTCHCVSGRSIELPGGDKFPPSDASR